MNTQSRIGFIGGGNMATSLIGGLINQGWQASQITAADPDTGKTDRLKSDFNINTTAGNRELMDCEVVVLAVKPQMMRQVLMDLAPTLKQPMPLFVSVAAGIRIDSMTRWLNQEAAMVRCMPNTPALVGCGATGLYANSQASDQQRRLAEQILQAVGVVAWVEQEDLLDAVTALSGSGPAYFMKFMEAMQSTAMELGLSENLSNQFAIQTCLGAARLAAESDDSLQQLRINVTSPGGTTEQALLSFDQDNIEQIIGRAMQAAAVRATQLGNELGEET